MADVISTGDWVGRLGSLGVWIPGCVNPAGMKAVPFTLNPSPSLNPSLNPRVVADPSTAPRSIPKPDGTGRIESLIYSGYPTNAQFDVVLNVDGPSRVSFYFWDYYGSGDQQQQATVLKPDGTPFSGPYNFDHFNGGIYWSTDIPGPCTVRWVRTGGYLLTLSGIFLDPPSGPPPDNIAPVLVGGTVDATGTLLKIDASEAIQGHDGFTLSTPTTLPLSLVYQSGDPGTELVYKIVRDKPIYSGEPVTLGYGGSAVTDLTGNKLVNFAGMPVANQSTAPGPRWVESDRQVIGPFNTPAGTMRESRVWEAFIWE